MSEPDVSDEGPSPDEYMARQVEVATSMVVDLIERMERAENSLWMLAESEASDDESEAKRLRAKASGVRLCLSYAREALRMSE